MKGTHLLMAKVMYGGGLRLMECLRLRVMDLDFAKSQVHVRGKGGRAPYNPVAIHLRRPEGTPFTCQKSS